MRNKIVPAGRSGAFRFRQIAGRLRRSFGLAIMFVSPREVRSSVVVELY